MRRGGKSEAVPPQIDGARFNVLFEDRFSRDEQVRVMDRARAEGRWEFVAAMADQLPKAALPALVAALDDYPIENPFECLSRCYFAQRLKDRARPVRWLRWARAFVEFLKRHPGREDSEERVERLTKKLNPGEAVDWQRADYLAAGFRGLDSGEIVASLDPGGIVPLVSGSGDSLVVGAVMARFAGDGRILFEVEAKAHGGNSVETLGSLEFVRDEWRSGAVGERALPPDQSVSLRAEVRPDASIQITLR